VQARLVGLELDGLAEGVGGRGGVAGVLKHRAEQSPGVAVTGLQGGSAAELRDASG
jgi:hypothetical protein